MGKLLSVSECASRRSVSRASVHAAIKRGALAAQRVGHGWVITEEACDAYQPLADPRAKGAKGAASRWGRRGAAGAGAELGTG